MKNIERKLAMTLMTVTPVTTSESFRRELDALNKSKDSKSYGKLPCLDVRTSNGDFDLNEVRVKSWSFQVPDSALGIQTVAKALGNGMADLVSCSRTCAEECKAHGAVWRRDSEGARVVEFEEPTLAISPDTCGWRAVWGGMKQAYAGYTSTEEDPDEMEWSVDFYDLHPGMKDGGCIVQSSSSSAAIKAEKKGSVWTITLTLPILESGQKVGYGYESVYLWAYHWHCRQVKRIKCTRY